MWPYLQKGDGIILVVMLKFRQILVVSKLFHPANLENDIFKIECTVDPRFSDTKFSDNP